MNDQAVGRDEEKTSASEARGGSHTASSMASMCGAMLERAPSLFLLMLPGAALILLGVTIPKHPQVLLWLAAGAAVLMGVAMLAMPGFMRRLRTKTQAGGPAHCGPAPRPEQDRDPAAPRATATHEECCG